MTGTFNNREIASALWLIVLLAFMLPRAAFRGSLWQVVKAFLQRKVLLCVCIMALYTAASVVVLAAIGLWRPSLVKDTTVWFFASALVLFMRHITSRDSEGIFRKVVGESLTLIVVLEFLANAYTFSLPIELILMPTIALVAIMDVVASSDDRYSQAAKMTKAMQALIGFGILAIVLIRAFSDLTTLGSWDTFRSVALAPLLSVLFTPCLYLLLLAAKYEQVFLRLDIGVGKGPGVKRYARRRILRHVGLSIRKVELLLRNHVIDLMRVQTEADVDRILAGMNDC